MVTEHAFDCVDAGPSRAGSGCGLTSRPGQVASCGLRQARYRGLAKTRLQHLLTGAALNVARLAAWFAERPRAATRPSRVAALVA